MKAITLFVLAAAALVLPDQQAFAFDDIPIANASFEFTNGETSNNEFNFNLPDDWELYDPVSIFGSGFFFGTLLPNGVDFFNTTAPDGIRVALLFNSAGEGTGEYGYLQTLPDTLQASTTYVLTVEVGNIASGTSTNGTFFNLDGFPGYRVDLLAGEAVVATDDNSLSIPEGEFATSTIEFTTGLNHPMLGQPLGIRLVNLNIIPDGFNQNNSPDLEVDFDQVALQSEATVIVLAPQSLTIVHGTLAAGTAMDLADSDNVDVSARRASSDVQSRVTARVSGQSPTSSPTRFELILESSVFARSTVNQTIELFDFVAGEYEAVDTRPATRFVDQVTAAVAGGDLSRFVEPGTGEVRAQVRYLSVNPRQRFTANIDQVNWSLE